MSTEAIKFYDMFAGTGGFREGLRRAGGFTCVGHCEIDKYANMTYNTLFDTEGEHFTEDARTIKPEELPDFDLLCGGFPCQSYSIAGLRLGFNDPRGTLFFEIARVVRTKRPPFLLLENVPGLLSHDKGRTMAAVLHTLSELGYHVEWMLLNSKDFGVPQGRVRLYLAGYLDGRCAGKVFPVQRANGTPLIQMLPGRQGERVYSAEGLACTQAASPGGMGGKTGLYFVPDGLPIKENTKKGWKLAFPGDSVDLGYAGKNTRRGRVGKQIAHTLTTSCNQGVVTETGRIRRLTPREALRLHGWYDWQIDKVLAVQSDTQVYKQSGNGVTVTVVEAIGENIRMLFQALRGDVL